MKPINQILSLAVAGTLAACGGGGGDSSASNGLAPGNSNGAVVSAFVTDNLAQSYSEVWVTVYKLTAENSASQRVTLFDDPNGKVINLATLVNIGELLNTVSLPAGKYSDFSIDLANSVQLVDKQGVSSAASFGSATDRATIRVDGDLTLVNGQTTSFALDFDLARFTLNASTNVVTPVVVYKDQDDVSRFASSSGEIEGIVQSVADGSFTLVPRNSTVPITVSYAGSTLIYDDETRQILNSATAIAVGVKVDVEGTFDQSRIALTATQISLEDSSSDSSRSPSLGLSEIKGVVTSFDGSTLTVDVRKASFVPATNTLTVANVTNARFHESSLGALQASGQWVELKGQWDGVTFTALVVEIEDGSDDGGDDLGSSDDSGFESESDDSDDLRLAS